MVLDTILGGTLGAAARLAPEVMTFFDKKNARAPELGMRAKQAELARVQQARRPGPVWAPGRLGLHHGRPGRPARGDRRPGQAHWHRLGRRPGRHRAASGDLRAGPVVRRREGDRPGRPLDR